MAHMVWKVKHEEMRFRKLLYTIQIHQQQHVEETSVFPSKEVLVVKSIRMDNSLYGHSVTYNQVQRAVVNIGLLEEMILG